MTSTMRKKDLLTSRATRNAAPAFRGMMVVTLLPLVIASGTGGRIIASSSASLSPRGWDGCFGHRRAVFVLNNYRHGLTSSTTSSVEHRGRQESSSWSVDSRKKSQRRFPGVMEWTTTVGTEMGTEDTCTSPTARWASSSSSSSEEMVDDHVTGGGTSETIELETTTSTKTVTTTVTEEIEVVVNGRTEVMDVVEDGSDDDMNSDAAKEDDDQEMMAQQPKSSSPSTSGTPQKSNRASVPLSSVSTRKATQVYSSTSEATSSSSSSSSSPTTAGTRTNHNIHPAKALVNSVSDLYDDLRKGTMPEYTLRYSPTVKFIHVPPPPAQTLTTGEDQQEENAQEQSSSGGEGKEGMMMTKSEVFQKVSSSHSNTKPVAVYLPGLDGVGISAHWQFDDLSNHYELWRLVVDTDDRSEFSTLAGLVNRFLRDVSSVGGDVADIEKREVLLMGESFGGLLAPAVALRNQAAAAGDSVPLKGLVMINPATSFDDTQWSTLAPLLTTLRHFEQEQEQQQQQEINTETSQKKKGKFPPTPYSVLGGMTLAAFIPDGNQFRRIAQFVLDATTSTTTREQYDDTLQSMWDGFGILADNLPAETLYHRITRWIPPGTSSVNPRLELLDVPTLILSGVEDNLLPTKKEGRRLVKLIPNATKREFQDVGHFLLDERVNLTDVVLASDLYPKVEDEEYDPITDWKLPSEKEIRELLEKRVKPLRTLTSPVFVSTDQDGKRFKGLGKLPSSSGGVDGEGPVLYVANHQFGGLDLQVLIPQMIEDRNISVRGLAHPILFLSGSNGTGGGGGGFGGDTNAEDAKGGAGTEYYEKFGAVMVTPRNYYRLMQTNQTAMLFPGGVREVFHGKNEAHQLFWPEKVDFVRTAAKFNATIVPLSAVGAADSVNILIDAPDMLKLPFGLGERIANQSRSVISARFDAKDEDELFSFPFVLPKPLPARHYFLFGRPMSTRDINPRDREACEGLYKEVQDELYRGFDDVLRAREKDPFLDSAKRVPYEQLTGKTAPTFDMKELH